MGTILEAQGLEKIFYVADTTVPALRGVSLQISQGEFLAILGPSGSGKSTLLHLLGGLDTPTAGTIVIDGTDISRLSENDLTLFRRKRAGFVFQSLNLLPTLTVYENIAIPFILDGRSSQDDRDRIEDLIELFALRGRESRRAPDLSAGEQQRVAIARALLTQPALVIADEPTGTLDSTTGIEILQMLWESCDNFGQTILLVTNHPRIAAFADRVVFIKDGEFIDQLTLGRRDDHHNAQPIVNRLQELGL